MHLPFLTQVLGNRQSLVTKSQAARDAVKAMSLAKGGHNNQGSNRNPAHHMPVYVVR